MSTSLLLLATGGGVQLHGCIPPQAPAAPPALSFPGFASEGRAEERAVLGPVEKQLFNIHQPTSLKSRSLCHPLAPHSGGLRCAHSQLVCKISGLSKGHTGFPSNRSQVSAGGCKEEDYWGALQAGLAGKDSTALLRISYH